MSLIDELKELQTAGIITSETAENIEAYYQNRNPPKTNRVLTAFGILGALLVGSGIILIIAHNWDQLSRGTQTTLAFIPLILGQLICGYSLFTNNRNTVLKEGGTTFLVFAIGSCIALVSQIYHHHGNLTSFLFTWALLSLPLIYVMRSSIAAILFIIGITAFGVQYRHWEYLGISNHYWYWILFTTVVPYYIYQLKTYRNNNYISFLNWSVCISVVISLMIDTHDINELMFVTFFTLFGLMYQIGEMKYFKPYSIISNAYHVISVIGSIIILFILSFDDIIWNDLRGDNINTIYSAKEFIPIVLLTALTLVVFVYQNRKKSFSDIGVFPLLFILFIPTFFLGYYSAISTLLINLFIFVLGVYHIIKGGQTVRLWEINYGLLMIAVLIYCRFFDTDISFVYKGIIFVLGGLGFFLTNYFILKKKQTHE
ncbi:DUF2157 domain-containing protein [Flammeovirga agarivorans]|uniref:DUF2157 domain-containing protein n=1 Tax=Flammeovirga agarivorans TaxID=2726742 RepID=A0A7X8SHB3_9BACT|nr:DUF2157 domain-containing protein [Flammeovirga agarivorans]NLR90132.1 DUF2157 domain-containing protein [Flammeovirga agarivorans]